MNIFKRISLWSAASQDAQSHRYKSYKIGSKEFYITFFIERELQAFLSFCSKRHSMFLEDYELVFNKLDESEKEYNEIFKLAESEISILQEKKLQVKNKTKSPPDVSKLPEDIQKQTLLEYDYKFQNEIQVEIKTIENSIQQIQIRRAYL